MAASGAVSKLCLLDRQRTNMRICPPMVAVPGTHQRFNSASYPNPTDHSKLVIIASTITAYGHDPTQGFRSEAIFITLWVPRSSSSSCVELTQESSTQNIKFYGCVVQPSHHGSRHLPQLRFLGWYPDPVSSIILAFIRTFLPPSMRESSCATHHSPF